MTPRTLLSVPLLTMACFAAGTSASPAVAAPPELREGWFTVDSFMITAPAVTTGAVTRFSFRITATVYGDLPGSFTEDLDCARVGDVVRCHGNATSVGADGTVGEIRTHITCTPLLICSGHSKGRGVRPDGERLVWHTTVTPGDGVGLYETRLVGK